MINLMDLVRSIAIEAARAEESTNYPLPCTPGSPLLATVRQACVERGFTASGVAVSVTGPQVAVAEGAARAQPVLSPSPNFALIAAVNGFRKVIHESRYCVGDHYKLMLEARDHIFAAASAEGQEPRKPTDISQRLREYAGNPGFSHNDYADTMRAAADECERFYGGMVAWKETAQQKDRTIIDLRAKLADVAPGREAAEDCDALNSAVQRAASELPDGYTITVEVERGYGGVSWCNPDGEQCDEYHSDILAEDVIDALADAKQDAAIAVGALLSIESEAA